MGMMGKAPVPALAPRLPASHSIGRVVRPTTCATRFWKLMNRTMYDSNAGRSKLKQQGHA